MSNYNKVKSEGVEELAKLIPLLKEMTEWEKTLALNTFASTFAEKVHKATLEDVINHVKTCKVPYMFPITEERFIRDIKTLTK